MKKETEKIPNDIIRVASKLETAGFEAFLVGGCVRDILLGEKPKDWDVATNARPEEVLKVFPDGKYENGFGTVMLPVKYLSGLPVRSQDLKISDKAKNELIGIAKKYLSGIECEAHRISHTETVLKNSLEIAEDYGKINLSVIELSAWFHDTGRNKYADGRHIDESQRIFEKEATSLLDKKDVGIIKEIINHHSEIQPESLENQIIREADIIAGLDVERFRVAKRIGLKEYAGWIERDFCSKKIFERIITPKGKLLLNKKIAEFNSADLGLEVPENEVGLDTVVEITTYRIESKYSDKRHPDEVKFAKTLEEDLGRRDFTVNALALKISSVQEDIAIIDLFSGQKDLEQKIIRAVGDAAERFDEDALRMMRAMRFSVQLGFEIEKNTFSAIQKSAANLKHISKERIRDELEKIILSNEPARGIELLHEAGLLRYIIPEIEVGYDVTQSHHHYYGPYNTVYKHLVASLEKCPSEKLEVRLAALLHDIGKPETKRGKGEHATFYNHEYAGARLAGQILKRLRFPTKVVEKVVLLVRNHMFYYNVDEVGEAGVRRVVRKVGLENINDLIDVRIADRLGSGVPKAVPYKLRHFKFMVEKVSHDAVSVKQLKINGNDLMQELKLQPGPKIGTILDILLSEVIEDATLNKKASLLDRAKELDKEDITDLRARAKKKIQEEQKEEERLIKKKYRVG